MIIGVVSLAGAGKDTFADYLVSKYGFKKLNTSDALVSALKERGWEDNKDNRSILADTWRKESGRMDIVTVKCLESIQDPNKLAICGFRSKEEADLMREKFSNSILIGLIAEKEIRFSRRDADDPQDREGFFGRDERDIKKKGLAHVVLDADHFLFNNGTLEEFYKEIDKLMQKLRGGKNG